MTGQAADVNAVEALLSASEFVGLSAAAADGPDHRADVVVAIPGGSQLLLDVKTSALISADSAPQQIKRWSPHSNQNVVLIAVADRITADARTYLNGAGWNWLDLRGHLRLTVPGLFIDADIPPLSEPRSGSAGFTGRVSVELAVSMLLNPAQPLGIRAAGAALARSPSSVSDAMRALRAADLVDAQNRPAIPELFWELTGQWKPTVQDIARLPGPAQGRENKALRLGLDDVEVTTGWALTDTVAAVAYGAPVAARSDHPRDLYVPDQATFRRALQLLGPTANPQARAGTVRVAPVPTVCSQRVDATIWSNEEWPLAHPVFVALDLAQDPGRGREILDAWTPEVPWHRVW